MLIRIAKKRTIREVDSMIFLEKEIFMAKHPSVRHILGFLHIIIFFFPG